MIKNKIQKITYLLFIIFIIITIQSCNKQNYKYEYIAEVTYQNGEIDTVMFNIETSNKVYVYLKIEESGLLNNVATSPCLVIGSGFYEEAVACGLRKYKILNETKTKL